MLSTKFLRGNLIGLGLITIWWYAPNPYTDPGYLPCQHLPGASDTLVVMKTGATELEDRLPPHLDYTLRCPPKSVIYSDHEEIYQGKYHIRDVLANISPDIQQNNHDFALYRRVKESGRLSLAPTDLTGTRTTSKTSAEDKLAVAGWILDKWKFIPMMNETYTLHPDMQWYVFIESDTYLFWSTTLKYVSTLNPQEPHCLGHRTTHKSDYPFMQGGAGYVLSRGALKQVYQYIDSHRLELERFIEGHWAGDIALGHVLSAAQVPLTYSWPIFQPSYYGVVDFGMMIDDRRYWCYPAASFHHMTPEAIEDLWTMEQRWIEDENDPNNPYQFLRLADVFSNVILPRMRFPRSDWDNQSHTIKQGPKSIEECMQACVDDIACVQYAFDTKSSICRTSHGPKYGEASLDSGIYSDWIFDRVEKWRDSQPSCLAETFLYYGDIDEDL